MADNKIIAEVQNPKGDGTVLKQSFLQSSDPECGPVIEIPNGVKLAWESHACFEDDEATPIDEGLYFRCKISVEQDGEAAKKVAVQLAELDLYDWNVFKAHWLVEGDNQVTKEDDTPAPVVAQKSAWDFDFKLPGYKSNFNMKKEIYPGSQILWAEALHFDSATKDYRDPSIRGRGGKADVDRIVSLGKLFASTILPAVKGKYGDVKVQVNSLYRPEPFNSRAGGASRSQHLSANAGDFVFRKAKTGEMISPYEIFSLLKPIAQREGFAVASSSVFTHIDSRGYFCTWSYGF